MINIYELKIGNQLASLTMGLNKRKKNLPHRYSIKVLQEKTWQFNKPPKEEFVIIEKEKTKKIEALGKQRGNPTVKNIKP